MKKLILISIFILSFFVLTFAQKEASPCPQINFVHTPGVTSVGGDMFFRVAVNTDKKLIYEWKIAPNIAFSGQGTSKIKIETPIELAGHNITATVKIKGLPENCNNEASDFGIIAPPCGLKVEDSTIYGYNFTDPSDDKANIDGVWLQFTNNDKSGTNYILFEIENDKQLQEVKERISFINNHIEYRGYDPKKFTLEVCKTEVYYTTVLHISEGKELPRPENCKLIDIH